MSVKVEALRKYFGKTKVFEDVSFDVAKGEGLMLSGPSGSGKTTLLRMVAGLERPDSGKILLEGRLATGDGVSIPPGERNIGMVFQDLALWPHMSVRKHLEFVVGSIKSARFDKTAAIADAMDVCELGCLEKSRPGELSGGEQQRLAIARALVASPRILLLDEPFSNLDTRMRSRICAHIGELRNKDNVTILLATHNEGDGNGIVTDTFKMDR